MHICTSFNVDDLCALELLINMMRTTNFRKTVKGKKTATASASTLDAVSYLMQNRAVNVIIYTYKRIFLIECVIPHHPSPTYSLVNDTGYIVCTPLRSSQWLTCDVHL